MRNQIHNLGQIVGAFNKALHSAEIGHEMSAMINSEFLPGIDRQAIWIRVCREYAVNPYVAGIQLLNSGVTSGHVRNALASVPCECYKMHNDSRKFKQAQALRSKTLFGSTSQKQQRNQFFNI